METLIKIADVTVKDKRNSACEGLIYSIIFFIRAQTFSILHLSATQKTSNLRNRQNTNLKNFSKIQDNFVMLMSSMNHKIEKTILYSL